MENLSKVAREQYNKLMAQVESVIATDKVREPKLNEQEKKEVESLEARIQYLEPRKDKLEKLLDERIARKKYIDENLNALAIDQPENIDSIINELIYLNVAIPVLNDTFLPSISECEISKTKIGIIKERARARELREEA